jgi:nucleoside-diphosphate-sugar epimerase
VERALQDFGPSSVVHLAGWGMSGAPMLSMRCHGVNALGTRNVIDACQKLSSHCSLVYLSTYNVIFGGQEILGGSEDEPYFQGQHSDQYAPSKTLAEKAVVEVSHTSTIQCLLFNIYYPIIVTISLYRRTVPRFQLV